MPKIKSVVLPDKAEIIRRLTEINPEFHLVYHLYPKIAEYAGQRLDIFGVTMMLTLTFDEFMTHDYHAFILATLQKRLAPKFIDAIFDDKAFANEAKHVFAEAINFI